MNPDRDFDRLLDQWFADGPLEVADRVVVQATDRIERQSQRPAWRLLWRSPMRPAITFGLAAAAVLVAAVVGFNLLSKGPTVGGPPATVSPTASSSPSPTPGASTYTTTSGPQGTTVLNAAVFDVPLSITFGSDWTIAAVDKGVVDLVQGYVPGDPDVGIHSTALVTLPGAALTDPWIPVPADFIAWVQQRPEWVASTPRTVTIAGRTGTLIDADFVWKDGTAARDFLRYGTGAWLYDKYNVGARARFIILPGPSGVDGLMVVMNAKVADFDAAAVALDELLSTIEFDTPN